MKVSDLIKCLASFPGFDPVRILIGGKWHLIKEIKTSAAGIEIVATPWVHAQAQPLHPEGKLQAAKEPESYLDRHPDFATVFEKVRGAPGIKALHHRVEARYGDSDRSVETATDIEFYEPKIHS
jgi:hypothetical protein